MTTRRLAAVGGKHLPAATVDRHQPAERAELLGMSQLLKLADLPDEG